MKRFLQILVFIILGMGSACAPITNADVSKHSSNDLQSCGSSLHAEIVHSYPTYASLTAPPAKIQNILARYISAGQPFDEAEKILAAADFDIEFSTAPETTEDWARGLRMPCLVAIYKFPSPLFATAHVEVRVFPSSAGNFSGNVDKINTKTSYGTL